MVRKERTDEVKVEMLTSQGVQSVLLAVKLLDAQLNLPS